MKRFLLILWLCAIAATYGQNPQHESMPPKPLVFVLGEIRTPAMFPYSANLMLSTVIGSGGGFSDLGSPNIYVIRDGAVVVKTRMRDIQHDKDVPLKPKDVIYIGNIAVFP